MQPRRQIKIMTRDEANDLAELVRSVMQDIGAIFEVLSDREALDPQAKSLCKTGSYLCDKWGELITGELEKKAVPVPSQQESQDRLLMLNPARKQQAAPA